MANNEPSEAFSILTTNDCLRNDPEPTISQNTVENSGNSSSIPAEFIHVRENNSHDVEDTTSRDRDSDTYEIQTSSTSFDSSSSADTSEVSLENFRRNAEELTIMAKNLHASGDNSDIGPRQVIIRGQGLNPDNLQSVSSGYLADQESNNLSIGSNQSSELFRPVSISPRIQENVQVEDNAQVVDFAPAVTVRWINRPEEIQVNFDPEEPQNVTIFPGENEPTTNVEINNECERGAECKDVLNYMQEILRSPSQEIFSRSGSGSETSFKSTKTEDQSRLTYTISSASSSIKIDAKTSRTMSEMNIISSSSSNSDSRKIKSVESEPNLTVNALTSIIPNSNLRDFWKSFENGDNRNLPSILGLQSSDEKNENQLKLLTSLIDIYSRRKNEFDVYNVETLTQGGGQKGQFDSDEIESDGQDTLNDTEEIAESELSKDPEDVFILAKSDSSQTRIKFWDEFYEEIAKIPVDDKKTRPEKKISKRLSSKPDKCKELKTLYHHSNRDRDIFQCGDKNLDEKLSKTNLVESESREISEVDEIHGKKMQKAKQKVVSILRKARSRARSAHRRTPKSQNSELDQSFNPNNILRRTSSTTHLNINSRRNDDQDNNNTLDETSSDETLSDITSKFRHSRDLSKKEEELRNRCRNDFDCESTCSRKSSRVEFIHRNRNAYGSRANDKYITGGNGKKSVRFENNFPVYLKNRADDGSGSVSQNYSNTSITTDPDACSVRSSVGTIPSSMFGGNLSEFDDCESVKSESEYKGQVKDSEKEMGKLFDEIKALWSTIRKESGDKSSLDKLTYEKGETKLPELIKLSGIFVNEIKSEWDLFSLNIPSSEKFLDLKESNQKLSEDLENCQNLKSCLETEVKYLRKEKQILNDEVKHLSFQIAVDKKAESQNQNDSKNPSINQSPNVFVFGNNQTQTENLEGICESTQTSSNQFDFAAKASNTTTTNTTNSTTTNSSKKPSQTWSNDNDNNTQSSCTTPISSPRMYSSKGHEKREEDLDSILSFVKHRGNVMLSLEEKLSKYSYDIQTLRDQVKSLTEEKIEICENYEKLMEDYEKLCTDKEYLEGVLQLYLKDKQTNEFSVHDLLETLLKKVAKLTDENEGKSTRYTVLETALKSAQEQNSAYKIELNELRVAVAKAKEDKLKADELQVDYEESREQLSDLKSKLKNKEMEFETVQKNLLEKITQMQEFHNLISSAKNQLEKSLQEKEKDMKRLEKEIETIIETSGSQQRKIQELERYNSKLNREIKENKKQITQMSDIASELRETFKDSKSQLGDRLKLTISELTEAREHSQRLQTQIETLTIQLAEANEKVKTFENERFQLSKQVLTAEEERSMVDRRLEEIRSAVQGDVLKREALEERNESLQNEINRLKKEKLTFIDSQDNFQQNSELGLRKDNSPTIGLTGITRVNSFFETEDSSSYIQHHHSSRRDHKKDHKHHNQLKKSSKNYNKLNFTSSTAPSSSSNEHSSRTNANTNAYPSKSEDFKIKKAYKE